MNSSKAVLTKFHKRNGLIFILFFGVILFGLQLGSTGLFDETPPLFAAAGRAMSSTGDWLTPRVNGLTRFDKPPLIYWLMGLLYSLPAQNIWDPLGTWSARLPSACSSLLMMLVIGDTLINFPQRNDQFARRTAVIASFAFALSPLVIIWSRIAVSDALLCSTLGICLIFQWRRYANPLNNNWWIAWIFLSLAVLTKGPVAVVLMGMTLLIFGILQKDFVRLFTRIKPIRGLLITALISIPWYLIELFIEGKPFWDSFFGYHNFQRLTSVVNNHQQPWWFFGLMLIVASLPFTPFLITSIFEEISSIKIFIKRDIDINASSESLKRFSFSWLISVLLLFTFAATKLPSYWLPATPAAAILISLSSSKDIKNECFRVLPFLISFLITLLFGLVLLALPFWGSLINDPELPSLTNELIHSGIHLRGAILIIILVSIGFFFSFRVKKGRLLFLQFPFIIFQTFIFLPLLSIGDQLRQKPLREVSNLLVRSQKQNEALAMVGINKPSIHFYTNKIVLYESNDAVALVNLADRLSFEKRNGWQGKPIDDLDSSKSVLVVIDNLTSTYSHWRNLNPQILGEFGVYKVWRLSRFQLNKRSDQLKMKGFLPNWNEPMPERF